MSIDTRASVPTTDSPDGQTLHVTQDPVAVEGTIFPQAKLVSPSMHEAPAGPISLDGQVVGAPHSTCAVEGTNFPQARGSTTSTVTSPAGDPFITPWPADLDYDLESAATTLDEIEHLRIASENRLRQFIRPQGEADNDGKFRGFGWNIGKPAVEKLTTAILAMRCDSAVAREALLEDKAAAKHAGCCLEHDAERNLTRALRAHPLGSWVRSKEQKGIGEKQGARLVGVLGDPYVRPEMKNPDGSIDPMRARLLSELRAYCGYGEDKARPGRIQRRARGQAANWSAAAKMRAHLIAAQCIKSGLHKGSGCEKVEGDDFYTHAEGCGCSRYRLVYDRERVRYAGAVHAEECVRCGPSGKPAAAGSPLSAGHQHGRALRRVAKEIVDDLWREARRIHLETPVGGQRPADPHEVVVADGD